MSSQYAHIDPLKSGSIAPPTPPASIDYTAWDYKSIKRKLTQLAQTIFGDHYNNFVEQDFGVVLMEYLAAESDMISYKLDYYINEGFLPTALLEKSIRRHARRVGYKPRPRSAAHYDFTASVNDPYSVDVIIPSGFKLETPGKDGAQLSCELFLADSSGNPVEGESIVIPAGTVSIDNIIGIEGELRSIDSIGSGEPFQSFAIADINVLPTSIRLYIDDQEWIEEEALSEVGPKPIFRIEHDDRTNQIYVVTGDDVRGAMVPAGSRVVVRYRSGGGERGNVPSGFWNVGKHIIMPGDSLSAPISFINRTRGRSGGDGESAEEIRVNLPLWYKSQNRLVHLNDYTQFSNRYHSESGGRVARGRAFVRHAGCSANIIDVFILEYISKTEIVPPSDRLISDLSASIDSVKMATDHVCVKPGQVVNVDIRIYARTSQANFNRKAEIENKVRSDVDRFFAIQNWNFGKVFQTNGLHRFLGATLEIDDFDIVVSMDPAYSIHDGVYNTRHWELIRPRTIEINIEFVS